MPQDSQTNIRIPKELKKQARRKALEEDRSLSDVIRDLLEKWIKEEPEQETSKTARQKKTE